MDRPIITVLESTNINDRVLELKKYSFVNGDKFYRVEFNYNAGGQSIPINTFDTARMIYRLAEKVLHS